MQLGHIFTFRLSETTIFFPRMKHTQQTFMHIETSNFFQV